MEPNMMVGIDLSRYPAFEPTKHGENAQGQTRRQYRRKIEANAKQYADSGGEPNRERDCHKEGLSQPSAAVRLFEKRAKGHTEHPRH